MEMFGYIRLVVRARKHWRVRNVPCVFKEFFRKVFHKNYYKPKNKKYQALLPKMKVKAGGGR